MTATPFIAAWELVKDGWKLATSNPWRTAAVALVLALGVACVKVAYYKHELAACETGRKNDQQDFARQVAAAQAATELAKSKGKDASDDAETYHTQLVQPDDRLRDYVAAHRVQARPAAPAGPGGGDDPAVHAESPDVPTVAVPDSVIGTCDADYAYAAAAYKFGQDLISKGLAVPSASVDAPHSGQ